MATATHLDESFLFSCPASGLPPNPVSRASASALGPIVTASPPAAAAAATGRSVMSHIRTVRSSLQLASSLMFRSGATEISGEMLTPKTDPSWPAKTDRTSHRDGLGEPSAR